MTVARMESFVTSDRRSFDDERGAHRHERAHRLRHLGMTPINQDTDETWLKYADEILRIVADTPKA